MIYSLSDTVYGYILTVVAFFSFKTKAYMRMYVYLKFTFPSLLQFVVCINGENHVASMDKFVFPFKYVHFFSNISDFYH